MILRVMVSDGHVFCGSRKKPAMIEIDVAMFESEVLCRISAALDGGGGGRSARLRS